MATFVSVTKAEGALLKSCGLLGDFPKESARKPLLRLLQTSRQLLCCFLRFVDRTDLAGLPIETQRTLNVRLPRRFVFDDVGPLLVVRSVLPFLDEAVVVCNEVGASLLVFHCDGFQLVGDEFGLVVRNSIAAKKAYAAAFASLLRALLELIERFQVLAIDDLFAS